MNNTQTENNEILKELQELEKNIQYLNSIGIRVNEELTASVEILKNRIDTADAK
jgi:hypothetical protein